jgi:hypothetical protein
VHDEAYEISDQSTVQELFIFFLSFLKCCLFRSRPIYTFDVSSETAFFFGCVSLWVFVSGSMVIYMWIDNEHFYITVVSCEVP